MIYPAIATNEYTYPFLNNFANFGTMFAVTHNEKNYYVTTAHTIRQIGDYTVKNDFDFWLYTELRKVNSQEEPIWLFNRRDKVNIPVFTYKVLSQTVTTGYAEMVDLIAVEFPSTEPQQLVSDIEINVGDIVTLKGYEQANMDTLLELQGTVNSVDGCILKVDVEKEFSYGVEGAAVYKGDDLIGCYYGSSNDKASVYLLKHFF